MKVHAMKVRGRQPHRGGFTLIELVVVLVILAIVAGLTVSIVDWIRRSANYGAASHNQQALLNNLQLFRTTYGNGSYPDRLDSLLNEDFTAASGWLTSDLSGVFTIGDLTAGQRDSLDKSGIKNVMDHDTVLANMVQGSPQNSGIIQRSLATDAAAALVPSVTGATGTRRELLRALYPADNADGYLVPTDVQLVLFGVGPANTAVGKTIHSPPLYTELDPQEQYGRFVVAVAVYDPRAGRRAQIKAVLDPKGRLVNRQVSEFWQSMNPD